MISVFVIILVLVLVLLIKISLMGCYIWYSEEGTGWGRAAPLLLAVPNVTAHASTASVPITVCCIMAVVLRF